jgi:hypothetical protein
MALERSTTSEQLADFDRMMAVLEEASARFGVLIEEAIRIAAFQLSGKRKLGLALLQSSIHGGDRARSQTANLLGSSATAAIDKDRRRRYKALARIPEDAFTGYLRAKSEKKEIPKEAGALRWVSATGPAPRPARPKTHRGGGAAPLPANLLAECVRHLGNVDVLVGKAKCPASLQLAGLKDLVKKARGRVLIVDTDSPVDAVRCVAGLVRSGRIEEALVVLPRDINHAWLAAMSEDQLLNMQITDMLSTDLQTFYSSLELANMSMAATDIQINKIQDSLKEDRATETDQIAEHERNIKSIDSMLLHVDAYGDKCSQLKNEVNQLVTMETQRRMDMGLAVCASPAPSLTVPRITDSPSAWVVPETGSGSVAALPSGLHHNQQPAAWPGAQQLQVIPLILRR